MPTRYSIGTLRGLIVICLLEKSHGIINQCLYIVHIWYFYPFGLLWRFIPTGIPQCGQDIIIGDTVDVEVNTMIVPTCFLCSNNIPVSVPTVKPEFFVDGARIPLNVDVWQLLHQLIVTNFTSLPLLVDGKYNRFECINAIAIYYSKTVTTLSKEYY